MFTDFYGPTIIPVLLVALAGWLILRGEADRARHRFLLFLLGAGAFLLLAVFLFFPGYDEPYNRFAFELPIIVMPALIGILVLIVLYLKWFREMHTRARIAAFLLLAAIVILSGLLWNSRLAVSSMILPGALILFLIWSLGWRFGWVAEALGLTALGTLLFFSQNAGRWETLPVWVSIPFATLYFLSPIFMVVVPALFLTRGLQQLSTDEKDTSKKLSRGRSVLRTVLAVIIYTALTYTAFWGGIWDQTMDLGFGFMIAPFGSISAIVAGLIMALTLRDKYRVAGLVYIILIPTLLIRTYDAGMNISHHSLTEERAEQIAQTLEQFHAREGYYPKSLDVLTPRELLYIPQPIIMLGEKWCYRGAHDFYQLAAVYREYWSLPMSLRVYASSGEPPVEAWDCEEHLAELKAQHDPPPFAGIPETVPTPVPLPTSVVTTQREIVQPSLHARTVSVGTWSPDGNYLILGVPQIVDDRSVIELSFLDAETGEICPMENGQWVTSMDFDLGEHHVWLPNGSLLFVSLDGDMPVFHPCEPDSVSLTSAFPTRFTHALEQQILSGRVLMQNQDSFWILNVNNLTTIQISGVAPNPYELHWDRFAWSANGNRLAISRLNGQTAQAGSTLFIVNGLTGAVEASQPLDIATDQSAPSVEWLSEDELLLHGNGALLLMDFRTDPPKITDVLHDIFLLELSYPNDISSFAWEGEHLTVRVNHPRNQGIYIYHPESGEVEIIQPSDASPLLFFPNGEMVEMPKFISEAPTQDNYELIWVDMPESKSRFITVQGHLPRNYPNLFPQYRSDVSQLVFSSSQGVSLVSIPDGETVGFWELSGGGGYSSYVLPPSTSRALIVVADGDGLYYIPLSPRE